MRSEDVQGKKLAREAVTFATRRDWRQGGRYDCSARLVAISQLNQLPFTTLRAFK